ncbi:MAG TPA: S41 family peptidase [Flavobacterium sp.]|uniref:S41 family peptidase n=1 Tax=Flavobacterium sp. TaxID=239 RepID=UPI002BC564F2|nr:S41 family peptidase [Flavobacterium sp.]HNP32065.1 S41 family peptidase [Flavobacterium sp.]
MKSKGNYLPLLLFACVAMGVVIGGMINFPQRTISKQTARKIKIERLIDFINDEYVDDVNSDSIVDMTVNSILANLDPHSVYLPPSEQSSEAEIMKGDFVGIGINFYMFNDTVTVVKPLENGPAAKAGILSGDRILYADKVKLFGRKLPTDSLYNKLKGEEGSKVQLTVFRKSANKKLNITVEREVVPIKSVDTYLMLNKTSGYIKINRFAESTYDEFRQGLEQLKNKGMNTLIIDLRDNGGGYLERAVAIADEFLKDKELVVFTKNRKGTVEKTYATDEGIFETGKVYVLIDENSASASEILAGALQDNDRATIVGRRSFGKGLVQREMNFDDGSAVRLTISRYYTPSGRSIQKPYVKGKDEEYNKDFENRFASGELYEKDKIKVADSLKFKTKKGRIVYGGGGIVPDIFVPLEVKKGEENLAYILNSGVVGHFVFEQLDKDRRQFKGLKFQEFLAKVQNDDSYIPKFQSYLKEAGLEMKLEDNKTLVKKYITAELARQLFGESQYYAVILKDDTMLKAILK